MTNEEIKQLYLAGSTTTQIAKKLGIAQQNVSERLRRVNTPIRSRSIRSRRYTRDHGCFRNFTAESLYWAGLLMADGYIKRDSNSDRQSVGIEVAETDVCLLEELRRFCRYTGIIQRRVRIQRSGKKSNMAALHISSREMVADLGQYGLTPGKRLFASVPAIVCDHPLASFYFRGLFDGDGCVGIRKGKHATGKRFATFGGTPTIVEAFQDACERQTGVRGGVSRRSPIFWAVNFSCKQVPLVGAWLYGDPQGMRLGRKAALMHTNVLAAQATDEMFDQSGLDCSVV